MNRVCLTLALTIFAYLGGARAAIALGEPPAEQPLPPLRTLTINPIQLETVSLLVPAARHGPATNFSCSARTGQAFNCNLPARVEHRKTATCPGPVARLLAERSAVLHEHAAPLTIYGGWQWDYAFGMCQSETTLYTIADHSAWETAYEAVLTQTVGQLQVVWYPSATEDLLKTPEVQSSIDVKTFSELRKRNGYPKERTLSR